MALNHTAAIEPPALDDAPVEMRLPVLPPFGLSQKHGGEDFATDARFWESPSHLARIMQPSDEIGRTLREVG